MTDTHTHTPMNLRVYKHTHISGRFLYSTPRSASWHTHTSSYELEICLTMTHTYTHSYPRLVALQNTYFSSTFTEAFLVHACGVTRNWRTYFISVRRVFLVETVVLQTVLWDTRAWSARFLVISRYVCAHMRGLGFVPWYRSVVLFSVITNVETYSTCSRSVRHSGVWHVRILSIE